MAALFIGALWLPIFDSLFHWDNTPQVKENRPLAPFPRLAPGPGGIRKFISGLDSYYTDHFGFRRRLIYWAQTWKRQWFKGAWQSQVIIGRQGWLYHAGWEGTENGLRVTRPFAPEELQDWRTLFESRRDWLARRGIHYLVVVPPGKQTIYPEYLPAWASKPDATAKLDVFMSYMKHGSTVEILDLRPALLEAKKTRRAYPLTGLHWNEWGAFAAYTEIVRTLARQVPGLGALPLSCFKEETHDEPGGDLAKLLAGSEVMIERDSLFLLPRPPLEPVPVAVTHITGASIYRAENPAQKGRAIIFGDSFAQALLPFLGCHFNEVILYDVYWQHPLDSNGKSGPAHTWIPALIEQKRPQVLIDEIQESLLLIEEPGMILRADGWK
jgi:hypothetical protein